MIFFSINSNDFSNYSSLLHIRKTYAAVIFRNTQKMVISTEYLLELYHSIWMVEESLPEEQFSEVY